MFRSLPMTTSPTPQFGTAKYADKSGNESCKSCRAVIAHRYYKINGELACETCAEILRRQSPADTHKAFVRGGQATSALQKSERFALLLGRVLGAVVSHEPVFYFIAAGAIWRLSTSDLPPVPGWSTALYFAAVMAGLAVVLALVPGKGWGSH